MSVNLDVAIIADDLTGAADTGVQFCPYVGPVYMTSSANETSFGSASTQYAGLSVFTNTRNENPARAADFVSRVAKVLHQLAPQVLYKKIDSCLRGNLGPEIDAMVMATGAPVSFIAPAFPQQGRTTVNDCHMINGVPVAETEIRHDPLCPVLESRISVLLASQSNMSIGHVSIECLDSGADVLFEYVQELQSRGCKHIVFDSREIEHLDAVARLARYRFENVLLVGSAGLAGSLARIMTPKRVSGCPGKSRPDRWLFVCGSASEIMAKQSAMLEGSTGWPRVSLEPIVLTSGEMALNRNTMLMDLTKTWHAGSLILCIGQGSDNDSVVDPEKIIQGLAEVVIFLLQGATPDAMFLSGGDTAEAILHQAGSSAILLHEEILPGLMRGEIIGGMLGGQQVFTKAGAFGDKDTLTELENSFT